MFSVLEADNLLVLTSLISIFLLFSFFTTCLYYWVLSSKEMDHDPLSYHSFLPSVALVTRSSPSPGLGGDKPLPDDPPGCPVKTSGWIWLSSLLCICQLRGLRRPCSVGGSNEIKT